MCEVPLIAYGTPSGKANLEDCDPKHTVVYSELTIILLHAFHLVLAFLSPTPSREVPVTPHSSYE